MAEAERLERALGQVERRFLLNLPEEELARTDFIADDPKNSDLPKFKKLQSFAEILFKSSPLLRPLQNKMDILFNDFCTYRYQIPVCGCILVNPELTHVVLVRNWSGNSWSWPKGKINQGESPYSCALRETLEETGYDASSLCSEDNFLVVHEDSKLTKLFVAVGVPNDTVFETQTRKEISKVEFHPMNQLPKKVWGGESSLPAIFILSNSPETVQQFIPKLQRFLSKHKASKKGSAPSDKKQAAPAQTAFDHRNTATFGDTGGRDWSVDGLTFTYDGNPHNFGSTHPSYVNYRDEESCLEDKAVMAAVSGVLAAGKSPDT